MKLVKRSFIIKEATASSYLKMIPFGYKNIFTMVSFILLIVIFSSCSSNKPQKEKTPYTYQKKVAGSNSGEYLDSLLDKLDTIYSKDVKCKKIDIARRKLKTSLKQLKSAKHSKLKPKRNMKKFIKTFCKELGIMNQDTKRSVKAPDFLDTSKLKSNQWGNFLFQHVKKPTNTLLDVTKRAIIKNGSKIDCNYKKKIKKSIKAAKDYINVFMDSLKNPEMCDSVIGNIQKQVLEDNAKHDRLIYFTNSTMTSFKNQVIIPLERGLVKLKCSVSRDKFNNAKQYCDKIKCIYKKYIPMVKELSLLLPKIIDNKIVKDLDLKEPILSIIIFAIELKNVLYSIFDETILQDTSDIKWRKKIYSISKYVKAMEKLKKLKYFLTNIVTIKSRNNKIRKYIKLHYKIKELEYDLLLAFVNSIKDNREWTLLSLKFK